ncbi:DUF3426 domain-containing protein [Telmatospirillum sp. J64-1]|uniref:DUF3426 domain-containing protein n=1 Tax=Telmatospirillum sp. J64-1 TaxID=2502183 RepID=UPI00115E12FD|nr:DUF3426 domain-containing protein [Telmatospirillum sp. J64-1]
MHILCPQCETQFSVPDTALGTKGRKMKCAKCGHVWHQAPLNAAAPEEAEPAAVPQPEPMAEAMAEPQAEFARDAFATSDDLATSGYSEDSVQADDFRLDDLPLEMPPSGDDPAEDKNTTEDFDFNLDFGDGPEESDEFSQSIAGEGADKADELDLDLDLDGTDPLPEVFTTPQAATKSKAQDKGKKKGGLIAACVSVLLLGGAAAGAWFFQDQIVRAVPAAESLYRSAGLRQEQVGAGLRFQDFHPERVRQEGGSEVLVVRGVIANVTDRPRDLPLMRLALFDRSGTLLQEKVVRPPVPGLEAGATTTFRLSLDEPHPDSTRFEITFARAEDGVQPTN